MCYKTMVIACQKKQKRDHYCANIIVRERFTPMYTTNNTCTGRAAAANTDIRYS
jgi:hypothetical protein